MRSCLQSIRIASILAADLGERSEQMEPCRIKLRGLAVWLLLPIGGMLVPESAFAVDLQFHPTGDSSMPLIGLDWTLSAGGDTWVDGVAGHAFLFGDRQPSMVGTPKADSQRLVECRTSSMSAHRSA